MSVDGDCIARLLSGVEREEYEEIERQTGAFVKQLFVEFFSKKLICKTKIFLSCVFLVKTVNK